ncbi:unnamed protein product [Adineta steineri]|uniref:Glycine-rich domain-containing protein-like n=1 Tax=Adineta steineri TaxID=433720 RepID=A0A814Z124_9BILA|nr:unnamed protein product [Adineta steineri]CAF4216599.1 unnamed protein product [Adineta steineri]
MGNSYSSPISYIEAKIQTSDGQTFEIPYDALVDHVLLLRQVIKHSEIWQQEKKLNSFVEDYCRRMAYQAFTTQRQQQKLPWQIEWIWHVHRLHPIAYNNDCINQLPDHKVVNKKYIRSTMKKHQDYHSFVPLKSIKHRSKFVPSLDLASAVLRQIDFLQKFQKHNLFAMNLQRMGRDLFEKMVQNYVSFVRLANNNGIIVPTFEIDLMWHTHMRFPSSYQETSKALCGFLLNHDDSIEENVLSDRYQKTADRWKSAYNVDYGKDIDIDNLKTSQYFSSCAMIIAPITKTYPSIGYVSNGGNDIGADYSGGRNVIDAGYIGGGCGGGGCGGGGGGGCDGGCGGGDCGGGGCGGGGCGGGCGGGD